MTAQRWSATIEDSANSHPLVSVGDLIVAVRTPRSSDFVFVEVGPMVENQPNPPKAPPFGPVIESRPDHWFTPSWSSEVHVGEDHAVDFQIGGQSYHLTLRGIREARDGFPWISCDLVLERL
jgi:hypothetical protein